MSPETARIAKKVFEYGMKYAKAQLALDAANRYSLKEEWVLPLIDCAGLLPRGSYEDDVLHIDSDGARALVWYSPYESTKENAECDGASCVPDVLLSIDLRPGAAAHDPGYRRMKKIAKAFGVPVRKVRKFLDNMFKSVVLAENDGKPLVETVATLTYWGVRLFGGIYHKAKQDDKKVALALAALLLLGGCAGCVDTSFTNPDDYVSPVIEKVQ
jgi:hypothetical protein